MGLRPVAAATPIRRGELAYSLQARSLLYSKCAAILASWKSPRAHSRSGLVLPRSLRLRLRSPSSRGWFSRILNRWRRALHNRSHLLIRQSKVTLSMLSAVAANAFGRFWLFWLPAPAAELIPTTSILL